MRLQWLHKKYWGQILKVVFICFRQNTDYGETMYVKSQNAGITKMNEAPTSNESVRIGTQV